MKISRLKILSTLAILFTLSCYTAFATPASQFYVSVSGSDANDCKTLATSCATITGAVTSALAADANAADMYVNIGPGISFQGVTISGVPRGLASTNITTTIRINGSGSANTTINDTSSSCGAIIASNTGINVVPQNITLAKTAGCNNGGSGIFAQGGAYVALGPDVVFGAVGTNGGQHMHAEGNAVIEVTSNYSISGNASAHFGASTGGRILIDGYKITCIGNRSFNEFAFLQTDSTLILLQGTSFSGCGGTAGARYIIKSNAVIDANGNIGTIIPGSSAGVITGGGRYDPAPAPYLGYCPNGNLSPSSTEDAMSVSFSGSSPICTINFVTGNNYPPICTVSNSAGQPEGVGTSVISVTVQSGFVATETTAILCNHPR